MSDLNKSMEGKYSLHIHQKCNYFNILGLSHKYILLESTLNEKLNYYKEREMKADARDKQHLKLIDYLQSKV